MNTDQGSLALVTGNGTLGLARIAPPDAEAPAGEGFAAEPRLSVTLLRPAGLGPGGALIERLRLPLASLAPPAALPGSASEELVAAFTPVLAPFDFGTFAYDPASELEAALGLAQERAGGPAYAAWSLAEPALFRFAFDPSIAEALDEAKGSPEWYRFAGLNELYRALLKAVLPFGLVPPGWAACLRESRPNGATDEATAAPELAGGRPVAEAIARTMARGLSRILSRPPERVLRRLARLALVEARLQPIRIETPAAYADTARRGTRTPC